MTSRRQKHAWARHLISSVPQGGRAGQLPEESLPQHETAPHLTTQPPSDLRRLPERRGTEAGGRGATGLVAALTLPAATVLSARPRATATARTAQRPGSGAQADHGPQRAPSAREAKE